MKFWKFLWFFLWLISLTSEAGTANILIERNVSWSHPVLDVFTKHGFSLYKVRYFGDGSCPVFYGNFKVSPKTQDFSEAYKEILKVNSNFPYALVDKKNKLMINVGWSDDIPSKMVADSGEIFSFPECDEGSRTIRFKYKMNSNLKKNILRSPYKALMRRQDGREFVAYLYAEDGVSEPAEYQSMDGLVKTTTRTSGNFYIYLYDPALDTFLPDKIAAFYSVQGFSMNLGRSDFIVLHHNKKNQSDILLLGVFVNSNGDQYEAYGFSEDLSTLKKYRFTKNKQQSSTLYGRLSPSKNGINGYDKHENITEEVKNRGLIEQFRLRISDVPGEIKIEPFR